MATLSSSLLPSSPLCKSQFSSTTLLSGIDFNCFSPRTTVSSSTISVVSPVILSLSVKQNRLRNSLQVKSSNLSFRGIEPVPCLVSSSPLCKFRFSSTTLLWGIDFNCFSPRTTVSSSTISLG